MHITSRIVLLLVLPLLVLGACNVIEKGPEKIVSPFNNLMLDTKESWDDYSFVVLGHPRAGRGQQSPNAVLQDSVQRLFHDEPRFVVSLGDLYFHIDNDSMGQFERWTIDNIPVPFFNAVGNHDTMTGGLFREDGSMIPTGHDPASYVEAFGDLYYAFKLGSELYVFLDTGRGYGMSDQQYEFLQAALNRAQKDSEIKNIFLFTHKVIWSYYNPDMAPVFRYRHPVRPPADKHLFNDRIKPLLAPLIDSKSIFLMAGDIGGGGSMLQTFYQYDGSFSYVATGMGNPARDSFVTVSVNSGEVTLKNTNFSSGQESTLENFGVDYWELFYREHPKAASQVDRIANPPRGGRKPKK
jgi:hypothetical protein